MKLIFVHGSGATGEDFYYQTRYFKDSEAVNLPGHPDGKPCTSIESYVEWLRGYIAGKGYKDVVVGGHSMGSAIVQWYALQYPQELKGIILLGAGARLRVHPRYLKECEDGIKDKDSWARNRIAQKSSGDPEVRRYVLDKSLVVGPAVLLNDLVCCDKFDVMGRVPQIGLPTLVLCGSEDVMTPVRYTRFLAAKIKGAREAVIEGATHDVMLDKPREVNQAIEEFLQGIAG